MKHLIGFDDCQVGDGVHHLCHVILIIFIKTRIMEEGFVECTLFYC